MIRPVSVLRLFFATIGAMNLHGIGSAQSAATQGEPSQTVREPGPPAGTSGHSTSEPGPPGGTPGFSPPSPTYKSVGGSTDDQNKGSGGGATHDYGVGAGREGADAPSASPEYDRKEPKK